MAGMDMGGSDDAAASTQTDAEKIAVRLAQIFAGSSYPSDLAGAIKVAQANGLEPADGNTIGGYAYDANDVEFKLCVENTSGAYAIYDTRPMSMRGNIYQKYAAVRLRECQDHNRSLRSRRYRPRRRP